MHGEMTADLKPYYKDELVTFYEGDSLAVLPVLDENSIDACVTDPPYELGFMGKSWDKSGIAYNVDLWRAVYRVLKPGAHLLAFGGTRTYHRMACAIEDAGFEIRDQIQWLYGSGFPKSLDVSKAIDKANGVESQRKFSHKNPADRPYTHTVGATSTGWKSPIRPDKTLAYSDEAKQWNGFGTSLKPANEPICLARKPLEGTVAQNVLKWGTGALNIDACRIDTKENLNGGGYTPRANGNAWAETKGMNAKGRCATEPFQQPSGRFPANVCHDGSDEVLAGFPRDSGTASTQTGFTGNDTDKFWTGKKNCVTSRHPDSGSAARFFYTSKASQADRNAGLNGARSNHPTVKPTDLMQYLCRLITPPGGLILDPFLGSGSTAKAAVIERFRCIGIELDPEYLEIAKHRLDGNIGPLLK